MPRAGHDLRDAFQRRPDEGVGACQLHIGRLSQPMKIVPVLTISLNTDGPKIRPLQGTDCVETRSVLIHLSMH